MSSILVELRSSFGCLSDLACVRFVGSGFEIGKPDQDHYRTFTNKILETEFLRRFLSKVIKYAGMCAEFIVLF